MILLKINDKSNVGFIQILCYLFIQMNFNCQLIHWAFQFSNVLVYTLADVPDRQHSETKWTLPSQLWSVRLPADPCWSCCVDLSRSCTVHWGQASTNDW